MIDRSRRPSAMLRHIPTFLLATLFAVACSDSPTETTQSDGPADLFAAGLAPGEQNPNSNGQTFVTFGGEGFGFGVVMFPEACFLFNEEPGDLPGSWMRGKPGEKRENWLRSTNPRSSSCALTTSKEELETARLSRPFGVFRPRNRASPPKVSRGRSVMSS